MQEVLSAVSDGVAVVTLNRPERHNALNDAMNDMLLDALQSAADDPLARVVVVQGAGTSFCVGADLQDMASGDFVTRSTEEQITTLQRHSQTSVLLREMPKPTIAAVNGRCAGAGLAIACAADFRLVSSNAVLKAAFASAAMSGDFGLPWSLTYLLGGAKAHRILMRDEKFTADEALNIGLADEVFPAAEFVDRVSRYAQDLVRLPPLALAGIKVSLNEAVDLSFSQAVSTESERQIATAHTRDVVEAAEAFLERREPRFEGR